MVTPPPAPAERSGRDDDAGAHHTIRRLVRDSGTSFYWAMRLLPRAKQEAMFAIYAFCRTVDDIADDDALSDRQKLDHLTAWRHAVDALYAGRADDPVTRALLPAVSRFSLSREDFIAILDGMEMDARGPIRAPRRSDLDLYCDRVAGAVGLLSVAVFGCRRHDARRFALATGRALQLTNILRDIDEDAERGRLYLPAETLEKCGIGDTRPREVLRHPALPEACRDVAGEARARFEEASALRAAMPREEAALLWPAAIMAAIYRSTLDRLERRGWANLRAPAGPGQLGKLLIAAWAGLAGS